MKPSSFTAHLPLARWWRQRSPREHTILLAAATLVLLTLIYLLLWQPAATGIRRMQNELPVLRAQQADMQVMAEEVRRLQGSSARSLVVPVAERVSAVQNGLERAGLGTNGGMESSAVVASEGESRVRIRLADVDYAVWATWLAHAEAELGARTVRANVEALNSATAAGRVRVDVVLEFAGAR